MSPKLPILIVEPDKPKEPIFRIPVVIFFARLTVPVFILLKSSIVSLIPLDAIVLGVILLI
jgi:hypothetical protein